MHISSLKIVKSLNSIDYILIRGYCQVSLFFVVRFKNRDREDHGFSFNMYSSLWVYVITFFFFVEPW